MSTNTKKKTRSSFLSLPDEIIVSILARVTRKYYPILSCVSKKLLSLLQSQELHKTRYLLGKHCFYVCLEDYVSKTKQWFTLNENRLLEAISTACLPEQYSDVTMVGMCTMMILDPRSEKLRRGSSRRSVLNCVNATMGLVDEKIYVFGIRREEIQVQILDLKTQIWQMAPTPTPSGMSLSLNWPKIAHKTREGPFYAWNVLGPSVMVYDPRDGKCDFIMIPDHYYSGSGDHDVCVIENVMYMYCHLFGLMWYNTKTKVWRVVHGWNLGTFLWNYLMVEYNGKLMFLWPKTNEIWCAMIVPYVNGEEIHARLEWSSCIHSDVKNIYKIKHCLRRMD